MVAARPLASALDPFLEEPGVLILDGGLGTELSRRGLDAGGTLWSTEILIRHPDAIRQLHLDYLRAGADVATTATYQASPLALQARGLEPGRLEALLRDAVSLAA